VVARPNVLGAQLAGTTCVSKEEDIQYLMSIGLVRCLCPLNHLESRAHKLCYVCVFSWELPTLHQKTAQAAVRSVPDEDYSGARCLSQFILQVSVECPIRLLDLHQRVQHKSYL